MPGPAFDVSHFFATDKRIICLTWPVGELTCSDGMRLLRIHRRIVSADTTNSTALDASIGLSSGSLDRSVDIAVVAVGTGGRVSLITKLGLGYMGGSLARSAPIQFGAVTLKTEIVMAVRLYAAASHAELRGSLGALPAEATHRI